MKIKLKQYVKSIFILITLICIGLYSKPMHTEAAQQSSYSKTVMGYLEIGYSMSGTFHEYSKSSDYSLTAPFSGSGVVTQTIPVSITRSAYNATYSASYSNAFTDMAEVFTVADGRPPEIPVSEWGSYCEFYATFFVNFSTASGSFTPSGNGEMTKTVDLTQYGYGYLTAARDTNPDWVIDRIISSNVSIDYIRLTFTYPELPVTLQYDLNGGSGSTPASVTVSPWKTVRLASVSPTSQYNSIAKTECTFLGWSTSKYDVLKYGASNPSNLLNVGSNYTITSDTTLYAVWKEQKVPYNIAFTLNGKPATNNFVNITGTVVDKNGTRRDITDSRAFSALEIPGYTVSASVKSTDENVFIINGNDNRATDYVYNIPAKTITTSTTDTINCGTIHTVKYDATGGNYGKDAAGNDNAGPLPQKKYYGTNLQVSSVVPSRIGYEFTGWKSKNSGTTYQPGNAYPEDYRGGENTLEAQWRAITYTVKFEGNTPPGSTTQVTGKMDPIILTYDVDKTLPPNQFKLEGCDFQGWNTKADGSGDSYDDKASIKNLSATQGDTITLYAQWKVTYKIVGSLNGVISENFTDGNRPYGKITEGKMIRNNAVAAYKDGDCTGDGRLTEKDAELIEKFLNNEVTPSDKQKTAMDVNGDGSITSADKNQVLRLIDELTLTASKNNIFKLSSSEYWCHDYPGYKISASVKCTTDDVYIMGINNEKYNNTSTTNVEISEKTINTTYTDTIRFGTIHTISFKPNDSTEGNGSTEATNMPDDITKYYDKDVIIPDAPERDGYIFKGWTSDKQPDKIYNPGDKYEYAQRGGTDTLTAQWEPITYTITFMPNKPAEASTEVKYSMDNIGAVFDVPQNLPENKYKLAGWVFQGWSTSPDGPVEYVDQAEVVNLTIVNKSVVKLYAQWKNIDSEPSDNTNDKTNYHGLELKVNNNGLLYGLSEEEIKTTTDDAGNLLKADNPEYRYLKIADTSFSIIKTADKNTSVYKNDESKYAYYKVKAGESYIETTDGGDKILHKFVGWSVYKYATLSQSPQVIHSEDMVDNMLNLVYEYQAVKELGFNDNAQPHNSQLSGIADNIIDKKDKLISDAADISDRKITIYAIWDEYPLMQVNNIAILSTDFTSITDETKLEEKIIKEIQEAIITDKEDGNWNKGTNRDITVSLDQISLINTYATLKDMCYKYTDEGVTYATTGSSSVNVLVTDKTGNVTSQIIDVWLNAANPIVKEVPVTATGGGSENTTVIRPVTQYVRFITREFYDKPQEDGGLLTYSRWKTNDEYKAELTNTFDILEKDEGYDQIWKFSRSQVIAVQNYVQENGLGNSESTTALKGFLERFKDCRIQ